MMFSPLKANVTFSEEDPIYWNLHRFLHWEDARQTIPRRRAARLGDKRNVRYDTTKLMSKAKLAKAYTEEQTRVTLNERVRYPAPADRASRIRSYYYPEKNIAALASNWLNDDLLRRPSPPKGVSHPWDLEAKQEIAAATVVTAASKGNHHAVEANNKKVSFQSSEQTVDKNRTTTSEQLDPHSNKGHSRLQRGLSKSAVKRNLPLIRHHLDSDRPSSAIKFTHPETHKLLARLKSRNHVSKYLTPNSSQPTTQKAVSSGEFSQAMTGQRAEKTMSPTKLGNPQDVTANSKLEGVEPSNEPKLTPYQKAVVQHRQERKEKPQKKYVPMSERYVTAPEKPEQWNHVSSTLGEEFNKNANLNWKPESRQSSRRTNKTRTGTREGTRPNGYSPPSFNAAGGSPTLKTSIIVTDTVEPILSVQDPPVPNRKKVQSVMPPNVTISNFKQASSNKNIHATSPTLPAKRFSSGANKMSKYVALPPISNNIVSGVANIEDQKRTFAATNTAFDVANQMQRTNLSCEVGVQVIAVSEQSINTDAEQRNVAVSTRDDVIYFYEYIDIHRKKDRRHTSNRNQQELEPYRYKIRHHQRRHSTSSSSSESYTSSSSSSESTRSPSSSIGSRNKGINKKAGDRRSSSSSLSSSSENSSERSRRHHKHRTQSPIDNHPIDALNHESGSTAASLQVPPAIKRESKHSHRKHKHDKKEHDSRKHRHHDNHHDGSHHANNNNKRGGNDNGNDNAINENNAKAAETDNLVAFTVRSWSGRTKRIVYKAEELEGNSVENLRTKILDEVGIPKETMRIAVTASDPTRRRSIAEGIESDFRQSKGLLERLRRTVSQSSLPFQPPTALSNDSAVNGGAPNVGPRLPRSRSNSLSSVKVTGIPVSKTKSIGRGGVQPLSTISEKPRQVPQVMPPQMAQLVEEDFEGDESEEPEKSLGNIDDDDVGSVVSSTTEKEAKPLSRVSSRQSTRSNSKQSKRQAPPPPPQVTVEPPTPTVSDEIDAPQHEEEAFEECRYCNRRFALARLEIHEAACFATKRRQTTRTVFDSHAKRLAAIMANMGDRQILEHSKEDGEEIKVKQKPNMWRERHNAFLEQIRYAKKLTELEKAGGDISTLGPAPTSFTADLTLCPKCGRKFNSEAIKRHAPNCKAVPLVTAGKRK